MKRNIVFIVVLSVIVIAVFVIVGMNTAVSVDTHIQPAPTVQKAPAPVGKKEAQTDIIEKKDNADEPEQPEPEADSNDTFSDAVDLSGLNPYVEFTGSYGIEDEETQKLIGRIVNEKGIDPQTILSVCSADFEGDGKREAFIFAGEKADDVDLPHFTGDFWFAGDEITKMYDSNTGMWTDYGRFADCGKRKFFLVSDRYVTGAPTLIYSVRAGVFCGEEILGDGYIEQLVDGTFVIYHDTYDTTYDKQMGFYIGHSWKPYYFFYDEAEDRMCEYESESVEADRINEVCGVDVLSEIAGVGGEFISAYKRANGLVTINYQIEYEDSTEYANATWDLNAGQYVSAWDTGYASFDESNYGGTYERYLMDLRCRE